MTDDGFGPALTGGDDDEFGPALTGGPGRDPARGGSGQEGGDRPSGSDRGHGDELTAQGFGPAAAGHRGRWSRLRPAWPRGRRQPGGTDPGDAPEHDRPRPRPGARRLVRGAVAAVLVLALLAVLSASALLVYASTTMPREPVDGLQRAGGGRMNVLVVGTDSRDGLSDDELQALGTEAVQGRRTDSIFLLSVRGGAAALLSFPRDLFVQRCDGTEGRINAAYAQGGPSCLAQTVAATSGIPVSHYVEVDFAGFMQIVDAVGGVRIRLDEPMVDVAAGVDLPAGCPVLTGEQALGFVRARQVGGGDLGRIARQQRFLGELAGTLAAPSTLLDPAKVLRVTGTAAEAVTADRGTGMVDLVRLARAARGLAGGGLATYTVPTASQTVGGAAVEVPGSGADALYSRFADGSILDVPPAPAGAPPAQPADVAVDVLNGAGVEGLAGQGREVLAGRGFGIGEVGNTDLTDRTVVVHAPGREQEALLVASQFAGVPTALSPAGGPDLALVLGPDADLSAPPPASAPAPPAPPPAPADVVGAGAPADC